MKFNSQQRLAVKHDLPLSNGICTRPLLVMAGPGTGKTRVIVGRVLALLRAGVPPSTILVLAFGNRAAEELRHRLRATSSLGAKIRVATFHSVALAALRRDAEKIGLKSNFSLLGRSDARDLMKGAIRRVERSSGETMPSEQSCMRIYSLRMSGFRKLAEILSSDFPRLVASRDGIAAVFTSYKRLKERNNVLDFDDLLDNWLRLLELDGTEPARYDFVLVDEFQDTNEIQNAILARLSPNGRGLFVVGDEAQSIFGFRGASIQSILNFSTNHADARVVTLRDNYRSTAKIVLACESIIANNRILRRRNHRSARARGRKPVLVVTRDDVSGSRYVARSVRQLQKQGVPLNDIAILSRTVAIRKRLERRLKRKRIPFIRIGGRSLPDKPHIRDIRAIWRWSLNPDDRIAAGRVIRLLPNISHPLAQRLIAGAASDLELPLSGRVSWPRLKNLLRDINAGSLPCRELLTRTWDWYTHFARVRDPASLQYDRVELLEAADRATSIKDFIDEMVLDHDKPGRELNPNSRAITLSTIHSAKGNEWKVVFVLRAVDGSIPLRFIHTPDQYEEERRLMYVAMSRARDDLRLICPRQRRLTKTGEGYRYLLSPFISKLSLATFRTLRWKL